MVKDNKIWIADSDSGKVYLYPKMSNRHGLIAGATGTGKTVTLKVMAESFSELGVPVFISDVKGDVAGLMKPGESSVNMEKRIEKFGLAKEGFSYTGYPVSLWDITGKKGISLRTTISEMGPVLLSRILELNDLQTDIMSIVFKIADDNNLLLIDTKDLKAMLNYVSENAKELALDYGKISSASIGAIVRAVVGLEIAGGDVFFGEPALDIRDFFRTNQSGQGIINILESSEIINSPKLYSTFLLWFISEMYETFPEVGDQEKPKMIFFFDEAHLLFKDAPKAFTDKVEQIIRLIRSKGIGIYFCSQNPQDIPEIILTQLNNKIEHGLNAVTPAQINKVKAIASSFRENPDMDTFETICNLGTGEAVISLLTEEGIPDVAVKGYILPPKSRMGVVSEEERRECIDGDTLKDKYSNYVDNESAYELLKRLGIEEKEARNAVETELTDRPVPQNDEKPDQKENNKENKAKLKAIKSVGNTVAGTVGREVGKQLGKSAGSFGKTFGGNLGASIARGIFSTLFKI